MKQAGNILLCGVGGQGILLASEVVSDGLLRSGFDVKQSEVHGMAQRGGSVVTHLRFGGCVFSPLIEPGTADLLVSFELLESLRYLSYLNAGSEVIVNTQRIPPASVVSGKAAYPADVLGELSRRGLSVLPVDAFPIVQSLGDTRAVNMVMVGALSRFLPVAENAMVKVISESVKKGYVGVNINAFLRGRDAARSSFVQPDVGKAAHGG